MPRQYIQISRELIDTVAPSRSSKSSFCVEVSKNIASSWEPNTDIIESEKNVIIRLELAGVARKDLCVKVKNGKLTVIGKRRQGLPQMNLLFHQLEIHTGDFEKTISLPETMEHNDITAQLTEGILEIVISKESQVVEIPISDSSKLEMRD